MNLTRTLAHISTIFLIFIAGLWIGSAVSAQATPTNWESDPTLLQEAVAFNPFQGVTPRDSPADRIREQQIIVLRDRVTIDIQEAQWSTFTDTHSMEPVITAGANAIQIVPKSADEIQVGDIVSYKSTYADGVIIHRVVYEGVDEDGTYFIMKGDNLPTSDPGRVRFEQIQRVVVAIVY